MSVMHNESVPQESSTLGRSATNLPAADRGREPLVRLMNENYGVLLRLIRAKIGNRELAEDLLNEACAIALERLRAGAMAEPAKLTGFVFRVSMNLMRNYRRNMQSRALRADELAFKNLIAPEDRDEAGDQRLEQLAREMLDSLNSQRDQDIVTRFYLYEHDKAAICRDFGLTSIRFNLLISRARQRMKKLLESKGLRRHDLIGLLFVGCLLCCHQLIAVTQLTPVQPTAIDGTLSRYQCAAARRPMGGPT